MVNLRPCYHVSTCIFHSFVCSNAKGHTNAYARCCKERAIRSKETASCAHGMTLYGCETVYLHGGAAWQGLKAVRESDGGTKADEGVQQLIRRRIEGYPEEAMANMHHARSVRTKCSSPCRIEVRKSRESK